MIKNINDLSLFLSITNRFSKKNGIKEKQLFSLARERYPYIQWDVQTNEILDMGIRLGLLVFENKHIILTQKGKDILDLNTQEIDLNDKQLTYITEKCVLNNPNFSHLIEFLKLFVFDRQYKTMIYHTSDYPIPNRDFEILVQLGIIGKKGSMCILKPDYLDLVDDMKHKTKARRNVQSRVITQEQLERILKEQNSVGNLGESLSMEYEQKRLRERKLLPEAKMVEQASIHNTSIGYDIKSFTKKTPSLVHNFFIEVKARKHNLYSFIMSANEIRTAKTLGKKYAIYFWNGLGYSTPSRPTRVIIDPFRTLKIQECENCLSYIIYMNRYNY